jgi:hypothetical protein
MAAMPIELTWLVPDKIVLARWHGAIDDYHAGVMIEEMCLILDTAHSLVHTLLDLSEVGHISPSMIYLYLQSPIPKHPNRGRMCGFNATVEGEILADLLNRITQHEMIRLFTNREDARNYLLGHDSPPPPLAYGADQRPIQSGTSLPRT